jgi:hypothetical protein
MNTGNVLFPLNLAREMFPQLVCEEIGVVILPVVNDDWSYAGNGLGWEFFHRIKARCKTRII